MRVPPTEEPSHCCSDIQRREGRPRQEIRRLDGCMPGVRLRREHPGKAPPEKPGLLPYRGKPAVRNDRGIDETSAPRSHPTEVGKSQRFNPNVVDDVRSIAESITYYGRRL